MATGLDSTVSHQEFGSLVGISRQAVGDLVARGIVDANQPARQMLLSYCSHLREVAAGRMAAGGIDLATERARLAKEQADRVAMQNSVSRRELAPVALIEEILSRTASRVNGIFDAIPGAIRRRAGRLGAQDIDIISDEIAKARNIVASMSIDALIGDAVASVEEPTEGTPLDCVDEVNRDFDE